MIGAGIKYQPIGAVYLVGAGVKYEPLETREIVGAGVKYDLPDEVKKPTGKGLESKLK